MNAASPDRFFKVCRPGSESNPEFVELLSAYGQAMWSWTHTESLLFLVFAHVVEPTTNKHSKALRAAFFSVVSPLARLDMINATIKATRTQPQQEDWKPFYNECRKELATRGQLAHLTGHSYIRKGQSKPHAVLMEPIWHPNAKRTHSEANALLFTVKHLTELALKWENLRERLHILVVLISAQNKPQVDLELEETLRQTLLDPSIRTPRKIEAPAKRSHR